MLSALSPPCLILQVAEVQTAGQLRVEGELESSTLQAVGVQTQFEGNNNNPRQESKKNPTYDLRSSQHADMSWAKAGKSHG